MGDLEVPERNSAVRIDYEDGWTNRVHDNYFSVMGCSKPGNYVHKLDIDLFDEPSTLVENLKKMATTICFLEMRPTIGSSQAFTCLGLIKN
jgi:hypothetical protein